MQFIMIYTNRDLFFSHKKFESRNQLLGNIVRGLHFLSLCCAIFSVLLCFSWTTDYDHNMPATGLDACLIFRVEKMGTKDAGHHFSLFQGWKSLCKSPSIHDHFGLIGYFWLQEKSENSILEIGLNQTLCVAKGCAHCCLR